MKIQHLLTLWLSLISILFGGTNAYAQWPGGSATNLALIASTDFSVVGGENVNYHSIDMLNNFGGLTQPKFKASFSLPDSIISTDKKSAFLDGQHYAITSNPSKLDSLRFIDNKDSGEWGLIISNGDGVAPKDPVFSMEVNGLKNHGNYRVVVEFCNPHSETYLNTSGSNKAPHLRSGYNATIKIAANNSLYGGKDARPGMTAGSCAVVEITNPVTPTSDLGPVQNNRLTINIYVSQMAKGEAIMIKSIKVYGEIGSKIIGEHSACVGGNTETLKLKGTYQNCTYQWYKDGKAISGATGTSYKHTTGKVEGETHNYYCEITTSDGVKFKSDEFKFTDRLCCTDGNGNALDEKLIWQDDFGTFTQKGSYWVWDYSDINNPVKLSKTTTDGWTYELPDSIPGAEYTSEPDGEGTYTVAANVTNSGDPDGTKWGWQAQSFYGKYPASATMGSGANTYQTPNGFVPDHTYNGYDYGAMLFLNCGNEPNATLYERTIKGLCDKNLTVKCHISNWTASEYPVKVKIRVTDLNSGASHISETATRYAVHNNISVYNEETAWEEISASIGLTGDNPSLKFEIISEAGGDDQNKNGNDLLLDDIQIWTCASPSVKLFFDEEYTVGSSTSCTGDDIQLYAEETPMIKNYYKDDARYIYQYTFDDPSSKKFDKKSWKPIPGSDITDKITYDNLTDLFVGKDPDDKIYFRVILGSLETFNAYGLNYPYNPDDACASYTVSDPIEVTVKCAACTGPERIKIKSDKKASGKKNKKDVIELCYGESVTLSQAADITPDKSEWASDFEGFAIKWFESETPGNMLGAKTILNDIISPKIVEYDDETLGGTELPVVLYAVDALYIDGTCKTADTIYIRFNPVPDAEFRNPKAEFCEGEGKGLIDMRLTNGNVSDYTIRWWQGADTLATPLGNDKDTTFFETLKATEGGVFSYQLIDNQTGCKGDIHNYEVIVNPIPEKPSDEKILYELTVEKEILTTDKFNQTLDSTLSLLWYTNVDPAIESNSKGAKSVEVYLNNPNEENSFVYYIAYKSEEGCFSERAKVDVTVSPITSAESILADENEIVNVYTVSGALIKANVKRSDALRGLTEGVYVVGNDKIIVK